MLPKRIFLLLCSSVVLADAAVRFTNIKCTSFDTAFSSFGKCNLKMISRGVVGLNVTCNLHKTPVTNVSVNLSLFKRSNGYQPFMYNFSVNFCKFLKNRQRYPLYKILADFILLGSNVNHTCPFDHDITVTNLVLNQNLFTFVPLEFGEYMARVMVAAYNDWKAEVNVFFSIAV